MNLKGQKSADPLQQAREILADQGLKVTQARLQILKYLLNQVGQGEHVSVEQLFRDSKAAGLPIGQATIYRVLAVLESRGLVVRRQFTHGHTVYELRDSSMHHHMVLPDGSAVLEFADAEINARLKRLAAAEGYEYLGSALVVYVRPCQATGAGRKTPSRQSCSGNDPSKQAIPVVLG